MGDADNVGAGDEEIQDVIEDLLNGDDEIEVDVADDEDDADDVEEDFDAVIISSSVAAAVIGDEYEDVEVPVMVMDAATYAEMNMTDDQNNVDFGVNNAVQELEVVEENHPVVEAINADEEDEVEISNVNVAVAFGNPDNDAKEIAEVLDQNNQVAIFEYEAGSDLVNDQEAEDDRFGFFLQEQDINDVNGDGEDLIEAAFLYIITGDAED